MRSMLEHKRRDHDMECFSSVSCAAYRWWIERTLFCGRCPMTTSTTTTTRRVVVMYRNNHYHRGAKTKLQNLADVTCYRNVSIGATLVGAAAATPLQPLRTPECSVQCPSGGTCHQMVNSRLCWFLFFFFMSKQFLVPDKHCIDSKNFNDSAFEILRVT